MAKKKSSAKANKPSKNDDKILFAFLATFLSIIGFVIALIAKRDNEYVMYYAKQSLIIFIIVAILGIIGNIFYIFPIIGTIINVAIGILMFILWLVSWIYAVES
ncbi:MAG: hypothetical protein AABX54_04125 [Nanoarchaeota archaeon]